MSYEKTVLRFNPERLREIKSLGDLPSPKGAALSVMRMTSQEDVAIADLARVVQTDPALVGRLMKAANSVLAGSQRPIASVPDALMLLGVSTVRYLALGFSLVSAYRAGRCESFDYERYWSHSLAFAVAMQALAMKTRILACDEAFSVGLLARVGELSLATVFPAEYARVLERARAPNAAPTTLLEREAFAMTHAELGAAMLQDWGIPRLFVETVYHHETPEAQLAAPDSREYQATWMLALSRWIADLCLADPASRHGMMPRLFRYGSRLSIESEALAALCDQVAADWQKWAAVLEVKANEVPPFEELSRLPEAPALARDGMPSATGRLLGNGQLRVLVVDDDKSMRVILRALLESAGCQVLEAANGRDGFAVAIEMNPHILIADWLMPEMDGVELARALRQTKQGRYVYILILTALDNEEKLVEAFDAGVDDFMTKPLKARVLGARLRAGQRVVMLQQEIERDREEIRRFAAELAVTNRRLHDAALTDVLTGLPNRRFAIEYFQREWLSANRTKRPLACMMIDIDEFKSINDTYGHDAGDVMLKTVASAIKSGLRAQDVVCRTGGDEFTVICPETDLRAALVCAERVRQAVAERRVAHGSQQLLCSVSIGVAMRDAQTVDIDALIKRADEGGYLAKQRGRNRIATVQKLNSPG